MDERTPGGVTSGATQTLTSRDTRAWCGAAPAATPTRSETTTISARRVTRWAVVVTAFVVALLACWQDAGYGTMGCG